METTVYSISQGMKPIQPAILKIGQVVVNQDKENRRAICEIRRNDAGKIIGYRSVGLDQPGFFYFMKHIQPVSDIFGIGVYYTQEFVSQDVIDTAVEMTQAAEKAAQTAADKKQKARAALIAALPEKYPHLEPVADYERRLKKSHKSRACAAANIRKELKAAFPGIKFRVKGDSFSMGDSIDVTWTDGPTTEQVDDIINKYSHGYYDAQDDYHGTHHSAFNDVFGSARFVHSSRELTLEGIKRAWTMAGNNAADVELDGDYGRYNSDHDLSDRIRRNAFKTDLTAAPAPEPVAPAPEPVAPAPEPVAPAPEPVAPAPEPVAPAPEPVAPAPPVATISEHHHTKGNFTMYLVELPERVDRETYCAILSEARALFGWYSRAWNGTPAGFGFKKKSNARQFIEQSLTPRFAAPAAAPEPVAPAAAPEPVAPAAAPEPVAPAAAPEPQGDAKTAAKLRKLADGMQRAIDDKFADRLTNTPKRLAQAEHARLEGEQMQRAQTVLYALADQHENGSVSDILAKFTTKKAVYDLMYSKKESLPNGYHSYSRCTGAPYYDTPEARALWALLAPVSPEAEQAAKLRRLKQGIQFSKIPGFFPTPDNVAARMLEFLDLEDGQRILEPNGGSGNLIAACLDAASVDVTTCEVNFTLCGILRAQFEGQPVTVLQNDFLSKGAELGAFDRVIMNPPFEQAADVKHIEHALKFLKPGGVMVALCAAGPRQEAALQGLADYWEVLPAGSFKEAGTGVSVALGVYRK